MGGVRSLVLVGLGICVIALFVVSDVSAVSEANAGYRGLTDRRMTPYIRRARVIRIDHGVGGQVQGTMKNISRVIRSRKRVVINGRCQSACTLFLSLGPSRVCITRRAELWFHQASYRSGKRSRYWTNAMLRLYPRKIRNYIRKRGGLRRHWIKLRGKRLRRLYPHVCRRSASLR